MKLQSNNERTTPTMQHVKQTYSARTSFCTHCSFTCLIYEYSIGFYIVRLFIIQVHNNKYLAFLSYPDLEMPHRVKEEFYEFFRGQHDCSSVSFANAYLSALAIYISAMRNVMQTSAWYSLRFEERNEVDIKIIRTVFSTGLQK